MLVKLVLISDTYCILIKRTRLPPHSSDYALLDNYEQCAGHMTIYSHFPLYCRVQSHLDSRELPGSVRSLLGLCGIDFLFKVFSSTALSAKELL